jgi:hypothetical protein
VKQFTVRFIVMMTRVVSHCGVHGWITLQMGTLKQPNGVKLQSKSVLNGRRHTEPPRSSYTTMMMMITMIYYLLCVRPCPCPCLCLCPPCRLSSGQHLQLQQGQAKRRQPEAPR